SQACEELSRQVRPERPKADKDAARCTCPSGDGSLRHPCPMHPGADKGGGQQRAGDVDERAAFEAWANRAGMGPKFRDYMFAAWEARAALSAPQAEQGERDA
ncbi:hypothetical protein, partial [Achromobacter ruhlandii]|uniref:hypothetical protein n=1 Tax=Achromobacter ruhlandii TaxID=72557 RepID=UPI000B10B8F3